MNAMYRFKEVIKNFYEKYDRYVDGLVRFVFALVSYLTIMQNTGYNPTLTNPFIAVGMAVVSAFLPVYFVTVLSAVLIVLEFLSLSIEVAAIMLVVFLLVLLLYFVFKAEDSWLMTLTMVLCLWNMAPVLLPFALLFSPVSILTVGFGSVIYGFISVVMKDAAALASATTKLTMGQRVNLLLSDVVTNEKLILILITLCASMLLITLIKKTRINDAPFVAVTAGDFLFIVVFLLGNYFLGITFTLSNYIMLAVDLLLNALISFIIINFVLSMDYKRTEDVQFEDDSYYYYVKAIPKTAISVTRRKVHNITEDNDGENGDDLEMNHVFVKKED